MDFSERIVELFNASIDIKATCSEILPPFIGAAGQKMVQSLIQDGKILVCGNGASASASQLLATCLLNRFEQERPGLPAIALSADSTILTSIANEHTYNEVFAKQIRALGHPSDLLVVISTSGRSASIVQAIQAAHDRDMPVIALTGHDGGDVSALLTQEDAEIRVPTKSVTLIQQVHQLIIHCLCDVIDNYLFGHNE